MNILAPTRARLQIEVVFDLVCPWCYLGVHRLRRTLRGRPDLGADLIWRPFLLNPDIAPGGVSRHDYMLRKFGGEERARRLHATIADLGRAEGLRFAFDRIRRIPPSLDAHRLVRFADRHGRRLDLVTYHPSFIIRNGGNKKVVDAVRDDIRAAATNPAAWGSVAVEVTIGKTIWRTSLFPSKAVGGWLLPLKSAVRRAERLNEGAEIEASLLLL